MPDRFRLLLTIVFLLSLLMGWGVSHASELWPGCAFVPAVRSELDFSPLAANATYYSDPPFVPEPGLSHAFYSLNSLGSSLLEAFSPGPKHRSLVQYAYADSSVNFGVEVNFLTGYDRRWDDPGNYGFLYKGLRVNSQLNGKFRLCGSWWNGKFHGDKEDWVASPLIDGYNNQNPDGSLLDNLNGDISYGDKHFIAALGRGRFQICNSISGSTVLSDRCNEYDYLLLEENFGQFRFTFLNSALQPDSALAATSGVEEEYPAKFLAVHQMTYIPRDWLECYIGETAVYGNRFDLTYLLPMYFWRVNKYNLRERDNLMIYGGANFFAKQDLTFYFNFAVDELTYNKFYTNWWGNKYALQAGTSLRLRMLALTANQAPRCGLEFTAVRPWTYTHYANVSMYSHDRRPLGYPKGANLLDVTAEINVPLPAALRWDSQISCTWQGSEGNDWRMNYQDFFTPETINDAEADWLAGDVSFNCRWQNTLKIGILAHHSILLGHSSTFGDTPKQQFFGSWQFSF